MTLIITYINKYGIVHASDSNLTGPDGKVAGEAGKVFPVPYLNAALSVAGAFGVGDTPMTEWMARFIASLAESDRLTLGQFARRLADALQNELLPEQIDRGSIIHLAGYIEENGQARPEFWHIRNVGAIDSATGKYGPPVAEFSISEDLWSRHGGQVLNQILYGDPRSNVVYINGFTAGRISFNILREVMAQYLDAVWSNPDWAFRPPASLDETRLLVELYIRTISTLFTLSNYSAPIVGGDPKSYVIPWPENLIRV